MIFVTGDCHGYYRKLSSTAFREQKEMDRQDFVIVCGDFGYWDRSRQEEYWMDWLARKDLVSTSRYLPPMAISFRFKILQNLAGARVCRLLPNRFLLVCFP